MSNVKPKSRDGKKSKIPPAVTWIGGLLGGIAAIVGTFTAVVRNRPLEKPPVEVYYYKVYPEAVGKMEEMVGGAFARLGGQVRFVDNQCLQEARSRTGEQAVKAGGESVLAAYFVGLKNDQDIPLSELTFSSGSGSPVVLGNVPPSTGVLLCYQLDVRGPGSSVTKYLRATYRSARGEGEIPLTQPDEHTLWTVSLDAKGIGQAAPPRFDSEGVQKTSS